jgi:hypothetical protein
MAAFRVWPGCGLDQAVEGRATDGKETGSEQGLWDAAALYRVLAGFWG